MSRPPQSKKPRFNNHFKDKKYFGSSQKRFLEAGQRGFLGTCNFKEKDCIRECYNILNEYADELYGPQNKNENPEVNPECEQVVDDRTDISDELQKEIDESVGTDKAKNSPKQDHRFHVVDTGTANCVFIKTILPDPVELGQRVVADIANTKQQKTRFLLRLLPIEVVCRANMDDILKAAGQLCDKYFLKNSCTYSIIFNKRYNNSIKRDDVIHSLAELVKSKNAQNKVDLKNAEKSFVVEVVKGMCCITVVEGYLKYKRYNLFEIANPKPVDNNESALENDKEDAKPTEVTETEQDAEQVDTESNVNET